MRFALIPDKRPLCFVFRGCLDPTHSGCHWTPGPAPSRQLVHYKYFGGHTAATWSLWWPHQHNTTQHNTCPALLPCHFLIHITRVLFICCIIFHLITLTQSVRFSSLTHSGRSPPLAYSHLFLEATKQPRPPLPHAAAAVGGAWPGTQAAPVLWLFRLPRLPRRWGCLRLCCVVFLLPSFLPCFHWQSQSWFILSKVC